MTERALAAREEKALTISEVMEVAKILAASGFFADAKQPAQAVAKILAGRELGFPPVYSLRKVYIVQGQVQIAAEMMAALVKRSGKYDYRVKEHTERLCILTFFENGKPVYESRYTYEDATKAGVAQPRSGWEKYPRAMLFSRALSQGARIVCPEVIGGVYTPEDFGIPVDEEGQPRVDTSTGEIIEGTSSRVTFEPDPFEASAPMPAAAAVGPKPAPPATEAEWRAQPAAREQQRALLDAGIKAGLSRGDIGAKVNALKGADGILRAGPASDMMREWCALVDAQGVSD